MDKKKAFIVFQNANRTLPRQTSGPGVEIVGALIPKHLTIDNTPLELDPDLLISIDSLLEPDPDSEFDQIIVRMLEKLRTDPNFFYLADRAIGTRDSNRLKRGLYKYELVGAFGATSIAMVIIRNALNILNKLQPQMICCDCTPHGFEQWVFCRIAEELDIEVLICAKSPMHWRYRIVKGVYADDVVPGRSDCEEPSQGEQARIDQFLRMNEGDYRDATPDYMKRGERSVFRRLAAFGGNVYGKERQEKLLLSWHLMRSWKHLHHRQKTGGFWALLSYNLARLQEYRHFSTDCTQDGDGVSFFLHYQFERTTLPEGRAFAEQSVAIYHLRSLLPPSIKLWIKEHPVMVGRHVRPTLRPLGFYRALAALPNTSIVDDSVDTFDLIDRSSLVSTVTGTVGFQALCRNRPVLAYGAADYSGHPCVADAQVVRNSEDLMHFIETSRAAEFDTERFLQDVWESSYGVDSSEVSDRGPYDLELCEMARGKTLQQLVSC